MRSIIVVLTIAIGLVFSVGNAKILPTNHYNVVMTCHGNSATCDESFDVVLPASGNVEATLTVSNGHCAPLKIDFMINGETVESAQFGFSRTHDGGDPVGGPLSQTLEMGSVKANDHFGLRATALPGGCAFVRLSSWGGDLSITTR